MSDHTKPNPETLVDQRIKFVGVRMPEDLNAILKDRAKRDGRSVGRQIVYYLENVPELKGKADAPDVQDYSGLMGHRYRT